MDKVTRQCAQTTTFLKKKESRSGIEPRSFRLPAKRLTARPNRLTKYTFTQTLAVILITRYLLVYMPNRILNSTSQLCWGKCRRNRQSLLLSGLLLIRFNWRACVRACVCVCARARVSVCARARMCVRVSTVLNARTPYFVFVLFRYPPLAKNVCIHF